jgi:hypothetical protein
VRDVLDAPGRSAEQEGLADLALEHHLFVELADAGGSGRRAGEEDAVEPAIRDGAALAMATRLAPSRPTTVWRTRSQVTRGRSSANSSDG